MALGALLVERRAALAGRWLDAVLAEYGPETAVRWRREKDPFANPVGSALAQGLPVLLDAVASEGAPCAAAMAALETLVRFRSVQDLSPSRAVGFVYALRGAIRDELAAELGEGERAGELVAVDARIERLAWLAFDIYVRVREQVFRLRLEELNRSVASILRRWHGGAPAGPAQDLVRLSARVNPDVPR